MTILMWDKPKKVLTVDQWANHYGFDGGPTGGYMPNMSEADQLSWKAKITGRKLGFPQVEIRKTTQRGSQVLIIINLGQGYNYKYYHARDEKVINEGRDHFMREYGPKSLYKIYPTQAEADAAWQAAAYPTKGVAVHISTNGPIQMTFDELGEMNEAIEEAKTALTSLLGDEPRQHTLAIGE